MGYLGFAHPEACMPKGMEAARRAVALNSALAEAHNALAMACLQGAWDDVEAEREFLRALELNPKYVQARDWYAYFCLQLAQGRLDEGVAQAKLALECDPLSSYANAMVGFTCCSAGKYEEAVQACQRAVELDSESLVARLAHQFCPPPLSTIRGRRCYSGSRIGDFRSHAAGSGVPRDYFRRLA
jgi:tetratricopeptide (TPR) repeat protein